jgi:hypothetical protein
LLALMPLNAAWFEKLFLGIMLSACACAGAYTRLSSHRK